MTTSNLQARLRAMADKMRDRHLRYEGVKGDYIYAHNVDEWAAELDALLREAAAHVSRERGMDETADALTLLRQLVAPCEPISFDKDEWRAGDHKWRDCRRCMALHALDLRFDLSMRLLNVAIKALASSAVPPERDPLVNLRAAKYLNPECYHECYEFGCQFLKAAVPPEHKKACINCKRPFAAGDMWCSFGFPSNQVGPLCEACYALIKSHVAVPSEPLDEFERFHGMSQFPQPSSAVPPREPLIPASRLQELSERWDARAMKYRVATSSVYYQAMGRGIQTCAEELDTLIAAPSSAAHEKATVSGSQGEGVGHCALAPLPEAVAPSEHRAYCPKSGDISGLRVCTCGTDVASLRAQLAAIQQRLGCVAELHISRVCELGTSGCAVKHDLRAQLAEAQKERDAEAKRVDIVIAEFDAPWPHSHTVGEVVSGSLAWKIHECRRIVEDARVAAEHRAEQAKAQVVTLREAASLAVQHFERTHASGAFQDDDEHEAWSALKVALLPPAPSSAGPVSPWQPIASAPKDGTRILLARRQFVSGEWVMLSGHWNSGGSFNLPHWSNQTGMHDPTHWMPLPAPPVSEASAPEPKG